MPPLFLAGEFLSIPHWKETSLVTLRVTLRREQRLSSLKGVYISFCYSFIHTEIFTCCNKYYNTSYLYNIVIKKQPKAVTFYNCYIMTSVGSTAKRSRTKFITCYLISVEGNHSCFMILHGNVLPQVLNLFTPRSGLS